MVRSFEYLPDIHSGKPEITLSKWALIPIASEIAHSFVVLIAPSQRA